MTPPSATEDQVASDVFSAEWTLSGGLFAMADPIPDRRRERAVLDKRFPHSNLINVEEKNA
jgi:hypothetical protein